MDYAQLLALRQRHPAWRLLRADHAPLIASFLQQAFVAPNRRSLDARSLASLLEDRLYSLNQEADEPSFRAPAPISTNGPTTPTAGCASSTHRATMRPISS